MSNGTRHHNAAARERLQKFAMEHKNRGVASEDLHHVFHRRQQPLRGQIDADFTSTAWGRQENPKLIGRTPIGAVPWPA